MIVLEDEVTIIGYIVCNGTSLLWSTLYFPNRHFGLFVFLHDVLYFLVPQTDAHSEESSSENDGKSTVAGSKHARSSGKVPCPQGCPQDGQSIEEFRRQRGKIRFLPRSTSVRVVRFRQT
ncbi:hypothetical protein K474DRAFT_640638 [Panus rudis PR-1116 ss-1]|nr:hypothetical protein K474DRAFT_640638 [Panus rudis PR-1116 ss-1]